MNIDAYLERINYRGARTATAETLRALQVAHLLAVPFENLSIHNHEPIILNEDALFEKIVMRRRGGFCYECNGLFASLLGGLGFDVSMLSAEVANANGGFNDPFDHMTLLVRLEQRWLADVGFGDSFLEPLLLDERSEQVQGNRAYRLDADGDYLTLSQRDGGEWEPQYRFTLQPYQYEDFAGMCRYHQTSPQSHFTQKRICSRATEEGGRITLSDLRLITTSGDGARSERLLEREGEYDVVLREEFGIEVKSPG
ncbi:MAG TPA: arylamine N-acetyltransferase [Pyrinomonadaceae bacterium]|nr:arylamine N-acetyltransferase [Pyrinomonadaceae bacterium]